MSIPVGILGATGLVGQRLVAAIEEHATFELVAIAASDDRVGSTYAEEVTWRIDTPLPPSVERMSFERAHPAELEARPEVILSALPGSVASEVEPVFAEAGHLVASNASFDRMASDVPLVIPEVNAGHIHLIEHQRSARGWEGALVKNPNCTAATITIPLAALGPFDIERVHAVTMQAISGAGATGVMAIDAIDNVLPNIPGEAEKLATEPAKLLGEYTGDEITPAAIDVDATCHRVPVIDGHLASVWVELATTPDRGDVEAAFDGVPAVDLPSAPTQPIVRQDGPRRPRPRYDRDAANGMGVTVGPVRIDDSTLQFECLSHNTIRGAAGACILAAELALDAGYL